jgi:hypothetical protein
MEFLSNINLNDNILDSALLNNAVVGSSSKSTGGAIKYSSGSLYYHNGENWVALSTTSGTPQVIAGTFNIYTSGSGTSYTGNHAVVDVQSTGSTNNVRILGNGKGQISFSGQGTGNAEVNATVVKVLYTNIDVPSTASGGRTYVFTHNLGTRNLLINTYFAAYKEGSGNPGIYYNYMACQCDIELDTIDTFVVHLNGTIPAGMLKIVVYGGAETAIGISANDLGQVIKKQNSWSRGDYTKETEDTDPISDSNITTKTQ